MYPVKANRSRVWMLAVDHARVAACLAAMCATGVASVCFLLHGVAPAVTALRAVTVFVLTYGACLGFLVACQRAVVHALAMEYKAEKAARRAARAAAMAAAQAEARGDDASESLTAQEA